MERSDIIVRAAADLRASAAAGISSDRPAEPLARTLCATLGFEVQQVAAGDAMLGGAYARLQLWVPEQPEVGGNIWVRDDLPPERRAFAIAHELGHFALHRGERIALHRVCEESHVDENADAAGLRTESHHVEEYSKYARRELEANSFAAELLAPRALVRQLFASERGTEAARLAARLGISETLARRRLLDAVLAPLPPLPSVDAAAQATSPDHSKDERTRSHPLALLDTLDFSQRGAACADGPALIVAGPGTGKTATLVGRVAHLVVARGYQPEQVLSLTFSNRAAGEMRERLILAGLPGERMPVMTIHAFATSLLREYAPHVPHAPDEPPLPPDFRILDGPDSFLLMEDLLAELPLRYYRSLGNPTRHLRTLLADFSQARDALLSPEQYLALVEAMPELPEPLAGCEPARAAARRSRRGVAAEVTGEVARVPEPTGYTREQIGKARERALAYGVWDLALRRRGVVDFGGLIQRAVELLRANEAVRADVRGRYANILVDEFQDTNRAAGELLMLVADDRGAGLWVVGDRHQSIYRWRGASPSTLTRLAARYPALQVYTLRRCYRSVPDIVRLGSAVASGMAALTALTAHCEGGANGIDDSGEIGGIALPESRLVLEQALAPVALEAVRDAGTASPVLLGDEFTCDAHERAGLAAAIQRNHTAGARYDDHAILCRTRKQVGRIAEALAADGIPVGQSGGFFDRQEIKDALALLALAAGPDARGVLRADALVAGLGRVAPRPRELAIALRVLVRTRSALPAALAALDALPGVEALPIATRQSLAELGRVARAMRYAPSLSAALADYLLRPHGYAWRLLDLANGGAEAPGSMTPGEARTALAALGELVRIVTRFDVRWSTDDDFRRRLARAVRHTPALPAPSTSERADTLEVDPGADAAETATSMNMGVDDGSDGGGGGDADGVTSPAVCCFLHYLNALRSADAEVSLPAGDDDAVHVLTLHASKGLEFPIVYLSGLADGQFPQRNNRRDDVCPPGFRETGAASEREAEERCLFYVGLTRARDAVVFTRAARYGKGAACGPSPLLALLDGAGAYEAATPLFSPEELAALPGATLDEQSADNGEDALPCAPNEQEGPVEPRRREKRVYSLHTLQQYHDCPRQYKYARDYGLLDPAEDAVHRFHRYLYRARRELRDVRGAAPAVEWEEAESRLRQLWATDGPAGHAYDAYYWRHAQRMLRDEWNALEPGAGAGAAALPGVVPAEEMDAELRGCIVRVIADRIPPPVTDGGLAGPVTLARFRTGRPAASHADDLALPLYALAHQQRHPDAPAHIALIYPLGSLDEADARDGEPPSAPVSVDVSADAHKVAESYIEPGRKRRSKLDKLDEAAAGIEARLFPPKPDEDRCAACAFCYVCPADPESLALAGNDAPPLVAAGAPRRERMEGEVD